MVSHYILKFIENFHVWGDFLIAFRYQRNPKAREFRLAPLEVQSKSRELHPPAECCRESEVRKHLSPKAQNEPVEIGWLVAG